MPERIQWNLDVQVAAGPSISASRGITVDAYDKIQVVIPGGDGGTPGKATVDVQPGGAGQVKFLLISADQYSDKLTYTLTGGVTGVKLDAQHLLIGDGAVGLLGAAPTKLAFSNAVGVGKDITLTILVGRKAT